MNFHGDTWTPEEDARLLKLASQNLTYNEIGGILDRTKGAIAGRLRRLRSKDKNYRPPVKGKRLKPLIIPNEKGNIHLKDIKHDQCHFPCEGMMYCGNPAKQSHGYCAYHHRRVYVRLAR